MPDSLASILLDENVPHSITEWLRGYVDMDISIGHVLDLGLQSYTDEDILSWAKANRALIVTFDDDFGDQRLFPALEHYGIIRLRFDPTTAEITKQVLSRVLTEFSVNDLVGKLVIAELNRTRARM
ncbi:MAG: DUF5615 family PIN-like protein [Chthonomonadales bacterium]